MQFRGQIEAAYSLSVSPTHQYLTCPHTPDPGRTETLFSSSSLNSFRQRENICFKMYLLVTGSTQNYQKQMQKKLKQLFNNLFFFLFAKIINAFNSRDSNPIVNKLYFHHFTMETLHKYGLLSLHSTMPKTSSKHSTLRRAVLRLT